MIRQGTYTKKVSVFGRVKRSLKRRWRWYKNLSKPKKILLIAGPLLAFLLVTPLLTYAYFARDIGDKERLMNSNNTGIVLKDINGETFYSTGRAEHRDVIPLSEISDYTEKALIGAEDKNFYEHSGFSITSILGALYANILSGDSTAYGGSTITQQLAKNTLLSENQTFLRKYQELAIAIAIEQEYSKDEILEMYLNSVYFGDNAFGIKDAAKVYFNKTPAELTLAESAMLIGVLPAPSAYSPLSGNPEYALERQNTVLTRMVDAGLITQAEKDAALATPLAYAPQSPKNKGEAPHFTEMVLNELYDKYGEEKVTRSGYQVTTSLDLSIQRQAQTNLSNHMGFVQRNGGSNASLVAIDPKSGEIRALIGSADWNNEQFGKVNMATSPRQPGSSFKPVYYAEALAKGVITPATIVEDKPTDFGGYKPRNANGSYSGDITIRNALSRSLNIPSVIVMQRLGITESIDAAKRMGITTLKDDGDYGLSLALGAAEAPLTEMTNVYAAFGNQGRQYDMTTLQKIEDKYNATIYANTEPRKQVLSPQGSFLISSILSDNGARAPIFGNSLTVPGKNVAVKTGTTDDQRDAWTIGYTPDIAIGVWVGNNDNTPMRNGGSGMAGPIWRTTMQQVIGASVPTFVQPAGIVKLNICYSNGLIASRTGDGVYGEYFLTDHQPSGSCQVAAPEPAPVPVTPETTEPDEEEDETGTDPPETEPPQDDEPSVPPVVPTTP